MKSLVSALALACAAPAVAQTTAPAPAAAPVEPARLIAAKPIAERVWPLGTYKRLMSGTMQTMMDAMMEQMLGMKAKDLVGVAAPEHKEKAGQALGDSSMAEITAAADPAFKERLRISTRVMFEEIGTVASKMEPEMQVAIAHALARRFTVPELGELQRFFSTPLGARYAADSMLLTVDPEMVGAMTKFVPSFMQAMPEIIKKVEAATAHLPPPPKPKSEGAEGEPEEKTSS